MKRFLPFILSLALVSPNADAADKRPMTAGAVATASAVMPTTMTRLLNASYDPQDDSVADFYMIFSDSENATWTKEDGPKVSDGYVLRLDCYAPLSERPIVLAEGTYKPSSAYTSMTYDPDFSYIEYYDADGNLAAEYSLSGDITVSRDGESVYSISVGVEGAGTLTVSCQIGFDDGTLPPAVFDQIKKDLDLTLTGALGIYDGNLYQSNTGSMYLNLYDHAFNEETGGMTEDGFSLALQIFGKLFSESKNATLDPGTYVVGQSFKRYTWYPGREIEYMGMTGLMGCYAKQRTSDGNGNYSYAYSYLEDGTIVIEDLGNGVFSVTVDAVTSYGHTVKATFRGTVPVKDHSDDSGSTAISTLEDDVELDLSPIPVCRVFNNGTVNGCQVYVADIGSPSGRDNITEGDIMRMEFVLAPGTKHLQEGTYTVMEEKFDSYYEPFKLGKGRFVSTTGGGTDLSGTRYMHFEEGRNLVMDNYAPAFEGTVALTKNADDTWTFNIHVIDDAQFRIDGDWTGPLELMYNPDNITAIEGITDDEEPALRWLDGSTFCIPGATDLSTLRVYNLQGIAVEASVQGDVVSLQSLPAGMYIIKYKSTSFKFVKK